MLFVVGTLLTDMVECRYRAQLLALSSLLLVGLLSEVLMLFWIVVSILLRNIVSMHVLSTPVRAVLVVLVVMC